MDRRATTSSERGIATIEFAITASFFLLMIVAVVSGGYLFWIHNALVEATRRGAHYAANQCKPNLGNCTNSSTTVERVRNVALYNSSAAGTTPIVSGLQASNITVAYSGDFGVATGNVSVKIVNFQYRFLGVPIVMPSYQTTVAGENAGFVPAAIP
jgi:Flp pilus assembly protein TadG